LWPTETIASLDLAPEALLECYEPQSDGTFRLCQIARDEIAKAKGELADAYAAMREEITELEAKSKLRDERLLDVLASREIRQSLLDGGVKPNLIAGAMADCRAKFDLRLAETETTFAAVAETNFGTLSISQAVANWLLTEGSAYVEPIEQSVDDGMLRRAIRSCIRDAAVRKTF
jgi:hypothetical protein